MMVRLKFMDAQRVACYLLPPQVKLDKERNRVVIMRFSVKLNADLALACDDKIQRAWEEIETAEREVASVALRSEVLNTDVDFYDLPDSKNRVYQIRNCTLDGLYIEKEKGVTYLYFAAELLLRQTPGLDRFALTRYGTEVYCDFVASQFAMEDVVDSIKRDPKILQAAADLVRPMLAGKLDSMRIEVPGRDPIVIDRERAEIVVKAAEKAKKAGKG